MEGWYKMSEYTMDQGWEPLKNRLFFKLLSLSSSHTDNIDSLDSLTIYPY